MNIECPSLDRISTLPHNIIENILSLMPIQDALRTSILSKKWQYSWRSMPTLAFTDDMVEAPPDCGCEQLQKYKLVSAIFHVLLLHNGPTRLVFSCFVEMKSEFAQMLSYLAMGSKLKEVTIVNDDPDHKLPVSFFSLQGLELLHLVNCIFEPPLTFNGFRRLKRMTFSDVDVSAQMFGRFLSKCPLLEHITLNGSAESTYFEITTSNFTFVDLLQHVPSIRSLGISIYYMMYLSIGGVIPHKLPTSLAHLKYLCLSMHVAEEYEISSAHCKYQISSAICIVRSSPSVVKIKFRMYGNPKLRAGQTSNNFLDFEDCSDLKLDHLEVLEIETVRNMPFVMDFVKLIVAKSPVLKKVLIKLVFNASVDEELEMLRDLVLLPFPRASPSAKIIIVRS